MKEIILWIDEYIEINNEKTMWFFCLLKNNKQNENLMKSKKQVCEYKINNLIVNVIDSHIAWYEEYENKKLIEKCFFISYWDLPFQRTWIMNPEKYSYYLFILK